MPGKNRWLIRVEAVAAGVGMAALLCVLWLNAGRIVHMDSASSIQVVSPVLQAARSYGGSDGTLFIGFGTCSCPDRVIDSIVQSRPNLDLVVILVGDARLPPGLRAETRYVEAPEDVLRSWPGPGVDMLVGHDPINDPQLTTSLESKAFEEAMAEVYILARP